jgi:uncharacterized protein YegJ (DUF2314 family)
LKAKSILMFLILVLGIFPAAVSQQPKPEISVAPNAPKDKPVDATDSEVQKIEAAIRPYIEKARSTYPQAKARFLTGLPPAHTFFVTTRLHDSLNRFEQVFIAVAEIKDGKIVGLIASQIRLLTQYRQGDSYSFPESELVDWTISKPDGTEEGNFVGNFLDSYQRTPQVEPNAWKKQPATPARMSQRLEEAAIKYQANAPIERVVFYDIAYPHSDQEYSALDGNALILFTAVAQDGEELPLQRVYVLSDGKEVELKSLKLVLSETSIPNSATDKTFGRFRADALYLLPMSVRIKTGDLLVNFQKNRMAFKVATLGTPLSSDVSRLSMTATSGTGPSKTALEEFIKREYPSFFKE